MNTVISPGDSVSVTRVKNGFGQGKMRAVAVEWTKSGLLKVRFHTGRTAVVSADNVKKLADGPKQEGG